MCSLFFNISREYGVSLARESCVCIKTSFLKSKIFLHHRGPRSHRCDLSCDLTVPNCMTSRTPIARNGSDYEIGSWSAFCWFNCDLHWLLLNEVASHNEISSANRICGSLLRAEGENWVISGVWSLSSHWRTSGGPHCSIGSIMHSPRWVYLFFFFLKPILPF